MKAYAFPLLLFFLSSVWFEPTFAAKLDAADYSPLGILRVKVNGYDGDRYTAVIHYRDTDEVDTIQRIAHYTDLGLAKKWGKMPERLFATQWDYAAFSIEDVSHIDLILPQKRSLDRMTVRFEFEPLERTMDYSFELNYQPGIYKIQAEKVASLFFKREGVKDQPTTIRNVDLLKDKEKAHQTFNLKPYGAVRASLTVIEIKNLELFRAIRTTNRWRYASPGEESIALVRTATLKKVKYNPAYKTLVAPTFMQTEGRESDYFYCVQGIYVRHIQASMQWGTKGDPNPKLRWHPAYNLGHETDSVQEAFNEFINTVVLQVDHPCNADYFSVLTPSITWNSDSLMSLQVKTVRYKMSESASEELEQYRKKYEKAQLNTNDRNKKRMGFIARWKFRRQMKNPPPFMPKLELEKLPMPEYDLDVPRWCTEPPKYVSSYPTGNRWNNGYWSWEKSEICGSTESSNRIPRVDSVTYRSIVFNPYTLEVVDPFSLFGEDLRQTIYSHMKELDEAGKTEFNIHQYLPENGRGFLWGLSPDGIIIYYGNEGEWEGWFKTVVPF
jgi:hypothetical protein